MGRKTREPKCIHRHTIRTHPRCFAEGRVLQVENKLLEKKLRQELTPVKYKRVNVGIEPWYTHPEVSIGYFDIETSNFTANNGFMVSWAIKKKGQDEILYDEITQKEILSGEFDLRIIKSLLASMRDFSVLVTYYGTGFDIPFVRTRAEYWHAKLTIEKEKALEKKTVVTLKKELQGFLPEYRRVPSNMNKRQLIDALLAYDVDLMDLEFPAYGEIYHFDLYYLIRAKFKFHRKSLGIVTEFFGIEGKTHLKPHEWMLVRIGDPKIMPVLKEHNLEDVRILEKLHERVNPYRKWTRRSI
jgi:uncharacterized protein YprB with RNaseH-like and TPR domain